MTTSIFEKKNIQKSILILGLPAMLGQLATLIYNMADTYFVSLTKSPAQIAAVTLSTPVLLIIMSISSICGMGAPFIILSNGMVHIFRSTGLIRQATIATQPLVETILAVICLVMYCLSCRTKT